MASLAYTNTIARALAGDVDMDSSIKVMLVTSAYVANKDHDFRNDVTNEVTGTGYVAGGAVATCSVAFDSANDRADVALGDATWDATGGTLAAAGAVYYKARGGASSADEVIAFIDFGGTVTATNATFTLNASTLRVQN
jgi:hypothetical protein